MANRSKRRIVAVIDENGVRRWVLPREGTPERTTLDSIMQIAAATNAEHPVAGGVHAAAEQLKHRPPAPRRPT